MIARTIKICVLAMLFVAFGTACRTPKSKLPENTSARGEYVVDQPFVNHEMGRDR